MVSGSFLQPCPVCGRRLVIEKEHAGTMVNCYHCRAVFCSLSTGFEESEKVEPQVDFVMQEETAGNESSISELLLL